MKAVIVNAPGDFGVKYVPVPEAPEGGLLLKVLACGLCGSDLRTLRSGHRRVPFPWTIGHEICGEVVALGAEYEGRWSRGERLAVGPLAYCGTCDFCIDGRYEFCENYQEIGQAWPGGFAEYLALPEPCVRMGSVMKAPADLAPAFAAVSEPVSSCINAQEKGAIGLGDTVVILGSGPIGCIHGALARAQGANRVVMIDILADRLAMAKAFEPDALINAQEVDPVAAVRQFTDDKGAEVVITATPAPIAQVQAVEMARKGGRILLFGGLPKDRSRPEIDMNLVHYQALHVIGTTIFAPRHQRMALSLMESGRIPADQLVTHRFALEDFEHGVALTRRGKVLKAVFLPA